MERSDYKYLRQIDTPDDLKLLSSTELEAYCGELRTFIIESLASNPGHLGASLGAVELAAAIHYIYDTPSDKLIWDVGHQAYAHKIITGRRDSFHTNRKLHGLSGFPRMSESPYDAFGGGHSSVSISAALGMAKAAEIDGAERKVVAVIGDGALTGGLAYEGLNNAGTSGSDILVILNDNNISIDPNVGAIKEYLLSISTSPRYNRLKNKLWRWTDKLPFLRRAFQRTRHAIKHGLLQQSNLFESLNFRYFGPVDGHDVVALTKVLRDLRNISGPKLLHVMTVKGKGYAPAEDNQPLWHAPGRFNPETGELITASDGKVRFQDVFGHTLVRLAEQNPGIVGITPAMPTGCSMNLLMERMPERCFDVGIAEGHAVTFSAGLAASGLIPFCNIYSSFMQRAVDNVIHDVALQNLGVVFCLDRAGLVGEDGATHHGLFDIAMFRSIPNMTVTAPMDEAELKDLMYTASVSGRPFMIRYPRGCGPGAVFEAPFALLSIGRGRILREGGDIALLSLGSAGTAAAEAAEKASERGISVLHVDLRYAKPLDEELLHRVGRDFGKVITIEEGSREGGAGSAVLEFFAANGYSPSVDIIGTGGEFIEQGSIAELHHLCGLDAEGILEKIIASAS